jgi:hypothetical protein
LLLWLRSAIIDALLSKMAILLKMSLCMLLLIMPSNAKIVISGSLIEPIIAVLAMNVSSEWIITALGSAIVSDIKITKPSSSSAHIVLLAHYILITEQFTSSLKNSLMKLSLI